MRENFQCEDCKEMIKADEFACNCLGICCGPCDTDCEYPEEKTPKEIDG